MRKLIPATFSPDEPLTALLEKMLDRRKGENNDNEKMTIAEQKAHFEAFLKTDISQFKVGDFIVRNSMGKDKYKLPEDGNIAMITDIHKVPFTNENEDVVNAQMMTVFKHEHDEKDMHMHTHTYAVDLHYYEKYKG